MFSGIIERTGKVVAADRAADGAARLTIDAGGLFDELALGASVAVNGVCLTLAARAGVSGSFDVIPETLKRTNLGRLRPGERVNLERSLRVGDRIDGHMVQGHVEGVGAVPRIDRRAGEYKLWVRIEAGLMPFVVPKGSIALDGVSLTIVDVEGDAFSVALIPTTLERTTLGSRQVGDEVNVETDILARIAVRRVDAILAGSGAAGATRSTVSGVSWEQLQAAGFVP